MKTKTLEDVFAYIRLIALNKKWEVNKNPDFLERIAKGLLKNFERYGFYLCPCRDSWGDREKDKDIICPCRYSQPDIDDFGYCYCALFLSKEYQKSGRSPESIQDRRPEELYP